MTRTTIISLATAVLTTHASGDLSIRWSTIDGGGQLSSGGSYVIAATIGQHDASSLESIAGYGWAPGFWPTSVQVVCVADCDDSGTLNLDDIDCFIAGFLGSDLGVADCDSNGVLNLDDIDCFVTAFLAGCS